jgi:hypothetical protein
MEIGALTILFAGTFGLIVSQWGISLLDDKFGAYRSALDLETTTAYGLVILSWILLALSTYASHLGIGSLYYIFWLYAGTLLAVAIKERFATSRAQTWAIAFLVQIVVLYPLIFDIAFMTFDSMRHTLADGTPELAGELQRNWMLQNILHCPNHHLCSLWTRFCLRDNFADLLDSMGPQSWLSKASNTCFRIDLGVFDCYHKQSLPIRLSFES